MKNSKKDSSKQVYLQIFNELKSVTEKYNFWESTLHYKYIFCFVNFGFNQESTYLMYEEYRDFAIIPTNKEETFEYNSLLINDFNQFLTLKNEDHLLFNLNSLIDNFNIKNISYTNKGTFLQAETERIRDLITNSCRYNPVGPYKYSNSFFYDSYINQRYNGISIDLSIIHFFNIDELTASLNGETIGRYVNFLNNQLPQGNEKRKAPSFTTTIQVLILYYEGFFEKMEGVSDEIKADFLGMLIGKDSHTIHELLSNLHLNIFSMVTSEKAIIKKNLGQVYQHFKYAGMKKEQKKVEKDLLKLSL